MCLLNGHVAGDDAEQRFCHVNSVLVRIRELGNNFAVSGDEYISRSAIKRYLLRFCFSSVAVMDI